MASTVAPFIGIDFGTSKSVMARYDAGAERAEVIYNQEGRPDTPSVVYLGRDEQDIVVGSSAEMMLDAVQVDQSRFAISAKRDLLSAPTKVLDGNRIYRPVDIAAKILGKLKDDAERLSFQKEPVKRAVITHPASFDLLQQDKLKQAAMLAGFETVMLLPEPVAAAIACSRSDLKVGKHILVYDFGGGTFDVAVIASNRYVTGGSLPFELALPPRGLKDCGGDDLDRKLYDYCEEIALQTLQRRISLTGDIDLQFLHSCRKRKENLSSSESVTFSNYLTSTQGAVVFEHALKRATFEERVKEYIERTILMTQEVINDAKTRQCQVQTVILIGGSSRIPLVMRMLSTSLPVQPQEWQQRDFAVALGAAYYAQHLWGPRVYTPPPPPAQIPPQIPPPPPPPPSYDEPSQQYRITVTRVWGNGRGLTTGNVSFLAGQARMLHLSAEEAAKVEQSVMGDTKEAIQSRTPKKTLPITLLVISSYFFFFFIVVGILNHGGVGVALAFLICLPVGIVSIVWLVRKPKGQTLVPPPAMKK